MYSLCVKQGACLPPSYSTSHSRKYYFGNPDYDMYPVIYVSWEKARDYCEWAGRRLPTEAEWERAARGDEGVWVYPWGNVLPDGENANFCDSNCKFMGRDEGVDDGYADTSPVDGFVQGTSPHNILNMAGNVWEWVADYYLIDFYQNSPFENPVGPEIGSERVLRGGSFDRQAFELQSTYRLGSAQDTASKHVGFRCAMSANQ